MPLKIYGSGFYDRDSLVTPRNQFDELEDIHVKKQAKTDYAPSRRQEGTYATDEEDDDHLGDSDMEGYEEECNDWVQGSYASNSN